MASPEAPKLARYKRIILCADGTWLASDLGDKTVPSNVATFARALANTGIDADGQTVDQIVLYHSGLGSGDLPFQKAISGGLGWGVDHDICQVYDFIANNYVPDDELFFFGFSRGAFTVRSIAGLVCDVGVLSGVHMSRFGEMWSAYRANNGGEPFKNSVWYRDNERELELGKEVRVKFVGVWETVGALGIPEWPLVRGLEKIGVAVNGQYAFHNTRLSKGKCLGYDTAKVLRLTSLPGVDYAYQALAIDEQRLTFPPTMWHDAIGSPAIELQQCWFPGVHGNIGGQASGPGGDHEEIGHITFAWMADNVSGMLTFDEDAISGVIGQHRRALNANGIPRGWGCGKIVSNFAGLQGAFFRLLGQQDRTPGAYPRDSGDGAGGATNECFHPIPIKGWTLVEPEGEVGWKWEKQGVQAIPEYIMRPRGMSLAYDDHGTVRYKAGQSLSRLLCPKEILSDLDRENGLALVAAVEVKEARASLQIVMEVEEQVRSGCELYCDKERKERVWGLSCYGTRFRFWIYDHLVKGLQPVFPSTVPPGNKDFYLEFASNEDDFMGMCDTINQYAFPSIELLAGYLGTAFDAPDDTMELDPLEDIQDVARDL
ncbi:hypothetical protein BN1723_015744 [Verticillium longisporum]|uniref:T6SS Phospholipase effector Tle1-like catalytic domain-containing protein n=1 Tax=Verticillium longisporum TaxID=100787 RepID=A0A0G4N2E7_VERLO|nr:hypothetical protein BN1723_015744 [Verticillium longisporum]